jgi:hypothetical protein
MPYNKEVAGIPTEVIAEMYIGQGKSLADVAAHFGVSPVMIRTRLHKGGYQVRPRGIQLTSRLGRSDPKLAAVESPSPQSIAWAAGLYEGEGSCVLRTEGQYVKGMQVSLAQKDRWVLDRMKALFGGSVSYYNLRVTEVRKRGSNIHVWHATGARAAGFVMTIYKFLSPRRQERIREALTIDKQIAIRRNSIIAAAQ